MPQHRSSRQGKSISADIILLFPTAVGPWPGDKTPGTPKAGSCCSGSRVKKKKTECRLKWRETVDSLDAALEILQRPASKQVM